MIPYPRTPFTERLTQLMHAERATMADALLLGVFPTRAQMRRMGELQAQALYDTLGAKQIKKRLVRNRFSPGWGPTLLAAGPGFLDVERRGERIYRACRATDIFPELNPLTVLNDLAVGPGCPSTVTLTNPATSIIARFAFDLSGVSPTWAITRVISHIQIVQQDDTATNSQNVLLDFPHMDEAPGTVPAYGSGLISNSPWNMTDGTGETWMLAQAGNSRSATLPFGVSLDGGATNTTYQIALSPFSLEIYYNVC